MGTSSRDADISDEELRKRMSSTADKLSRYLHEQTHLIRDIEVQLQDSNRCVVDFIVLDAHLYVYFPNHVSSFLLHTGMIRSSTSWC